MPNRLLDQLEAKEKEGPPVRDVRLPSSDALVRAAVEAERALNRKKVNGAPEDEVAVAEEESKAARKALSDSMIVLTLRALPGPQWDRLQRSHPPTPAQKAEFKDRFGSMATPPYDADALLASAWEVMQVPAEGDDPLTLEQCKRFVDRWTSGEREYMLREVTALNEAVVSAESLGE